MQKTLKTYLRRLTNLTSRNRSLLLLSLPKEQFLDLHELDFLDEKPSYHIINQLISSKNKIPICPVLDSRYEKVNEISKRLRAIARTENFIAEERGAKDLYVGYPIIKGKLQDGTLVRCPLLFWAVSLNNNGKKWYLEQRDEPLSFNRSFLLAYAHFNQISLSEEWLERNFEEAEKNSLAFRTQLYELLKESPLSLNFNSEIFTDNLHFFEKFTKADLELLEHNGELRLYPQAVLGIFPQAGSFLVPDYDFLIEQNIADQLQNFDGFFQHANEDNKVKEENTFLPFQADASQEKAILQIKAGKSLVIEGPPGTGKSQLIANLVADFAARDKKVLLVCQKRVALDTVFERLSRIKTNSFVALIHDFKNDRKALFEQITNQIEKIEAYKKQNQSLDRIILERNFTQISRKIDQITKDLEELKIALFDDSICSESVKNLYLKSNPNDAQIDLSTQYKSFKLNEIKDFEAKISQYFEYHSLLKDEFWQKRNSFSKHDFSALQQIEFVINEITQKQSKTQQESKLLLNKNFDLAELIQIDENQLSDFLSHFESNEIIEVFQEIALNKNYYLKPNELNKFEQYLDDLKAIQLQNGIEKTLQVGELHLRKIQISKALEASKSGISWLSWKVFSKDKKDIENILLLNKFSLASSDLEKLLQKLENRIAFEGIAEKFQKKNIKLIVNAAWERQQILIENVLKANAAFYIYEEAKYLKNTNLLTINFRNPLLQFIELVRETKANYQNWKNWLSEPQIIEISKNNLDNILIINYLKTNFDSFIEIDKLKNSFNNAELSVIKSLEDIKHSQKNKLFIFQNSLYLSWINYIESTYPILRGVSSMKIKQLEEELQSLVREKQNLSEEILLIKLRENTYNNLVFNRLQNIITYRDLLHQVTKRKKIWSVRRLLEEFYNEIFKLVPCWMASPESVSAIFPMQANLFDLVIFDEASQCYAEQGIPSIFRGKQVVIAGDSKQLQPTDLYQIRYEEDTENEPILEIDSLLDLARHYLPSIQLLGHYRSHSLDLIQFSNAYFYKNTLHLLPYYQSITKNTPSIKYILTNGIWENSTNEIEAQKTIELVQNLQKNDPHKSIGIITFNYKQANLIGDLLSHENQIFMPLEASQNHKERLFVKNIENVQGDERDIIIFSVGYAPNAKGRMLMQFGSLNATGGENRLNVAITRAKEQVYIISSILPHQLQVEDSINDGPKLLKKYLEYALDVSEGRFLPKPTISKKYNSTELLKTKLLTDNTIQELPFADLTIKHDGQCQSLVLTDDDIYFESLSAKEAHAYLPMSLQDKGWKYERKWSRVFWANR